MEDLNLFWIVFGVLHGGFLGAFAFGWNQSTRVFWMQFWGIIYIVLNVLAPIFSGVKVLPWFVTQFVWVSTAMFLLLCFISWLVYRNKPAKQLVDKKAEAVKKEVQVKGVDYSGYIKTEKDDIDFLRGVLLQWAQFPDNEVEALLESLVGVGMLTDKYLRSEGFSTEDNSDTDPVTVNLIKVGEGEWVVDDMTFEDLEELAEACEGNLE